MTPIATARRNLVQRIDNLLRRVAAGTLEPTAWQIDQVQRAIEQLEEERFAEGERTMSEAERPDLYQPAGYAGAGPAEPARLVDRLAAVVTSTST